MDLYSFLPQMLNKEEIARKSEQMDKFWKLVSTNQANLLPMLRKELMREDNPPFFYYDGSKLLLSLSNEIGDKKLAAASIARCDLQGVKPKDYLTLQRNLIYKAQLSSTVRKVSPMISLLNPLDHINCHFDVVLSQRQHDFNEGSKLRYGNRRCFFSPT